MLGGLVSFIVRKSFSPSPTDANIRGERNVHAAEGIMAVGSRVVGWRASSLLAGCCGLTLAACGDTALRDGEASADASTADGGTSAVDSGAPGVSNSDSGGAASDILLDIIHAAPDTPNVGLCLAAVIGGLPQFVAPFDRVQGPLPRYAGAQLRIPAALQTAISNVAVRVYLVPGYAAPADAAAPACAAVVAATASVVLLKEFPAGYFQPGRGYVIAATGCSAPNATVAKCGANPLAPTNPRPLSAWTSDFDRSIVGPLEFAGQVVHLSPQLESSSFPVAVPDAGYAMIPVFARGLKVALGTPGAAAGTYTMQSWLSGVSPRTFAAAPSAKVAAEVGDGGTNPNAFALGIYTAGASTPTPPPVGLVTTVPLPYVSAATLGPSHPGVSSYFSLGVTYTLFIMGDPLQSSNPQAPNAGPDFLRVLAFPNNTPPTSAPPAAADASVADASAN